MAVRHRPAGPALALVVSLSAHATFAALVGGGFLVFGARDPKAAPSIEVDVVDSPVTAADVPTAPLPITDAPPPSPTRSRSRPTPVTSSTKPLVDPPSPPAAPSSAEVMPQVSAPPMRFSMSAGTIAGRGLPAASARGGSGPTTGHATGPSGAASNDADSGGGEIFGEDRINVPARLLSSASVPYPASARQAEVEADVQVQIVVGIDGRVDEARIVKPCGYGLDEAALEGVRAFRFSPALRDGRPVRVRMRWPVQFRLR